MNFKIPFMKYRKIAAIASLVLFAVSILSIALRGLSLGLDFSGGTLVELTFKETVPLESLRGDLSANDYEDFQVVNFGSDTDVLIKIADLDGNSSLEMKYMI